MLPKSKLTKLIQAVEHLYTSPDDEGEPGAKVHCIVKGTVVPPRIPLGSARHLYLEK